MLKTVCDIRVALAFIMAFSFGFLFNQPFASAVDYHSACSTATGASATGLDGSNCNAGLICDSELSICALPTEVACIARSKGSSCPVGMACVDEAGKKVEPVSGKYGTCQPYKGASTENNAISEVLCNVYNFATGKTGRIIIGIIFVGAGATFLLGSMKLGTLLAITIGAAFIFGGPAIVSVLVGKGFVC